MKQSIDYDFDQLVPDAARHAQHFLGALDQRCREEPGVAEWGFGLRKPNRLKDRVVLNGSFQMGNMWRKARPVQLQAYADPVGTHLQVGYQITWGSGLFWSALPIAEDNPNLLRKVDGLVAVFQQAVFLPAFEQLLDGATQDKLD